MLDYDLAFLYGVQTKALNQAVKRNIHRFPADFMFQLNEYETEKLRSQFVTGSKLKANIRFKPTAFTELGIAMLSGVLNSNQAIKVHVSIIRVFFKLREALRADQNLSERMDRIEKNANHLFKVVFERLEQLEAKETLSPTPPKRRIGI